MKSLARRLDPLATLNRWHDADKCLLVSGITLPFSAAWVVRLHAIAADPTTSVYVSRSFLPVMIAYQWAQTVGHLLIIVASLVLRRSAERAHPALVTVEVQWWMACFAFSLYALGPFTSPFGMLVLLLPVAGLLIYEARPMMRGLAALFVYVVAMVVLERLSLVPYAPFLDRPPFEEGRLVNGWVVSIGLPTLFATVLILALYAWVVVQWRRRESELEQLTRTDPLTGVANRRVFFERLALEIERARRHGTSVSIVMLDVDHFKSINDTHGHQRGDEALAHVARALDASIRVLDLVARYGGEEFAILLADTALPTAEGVAERCREALHALTLEGRAGPISVTASFGVATLRAEEDADGLVSRADDALYRAKLDGRDRVAVAV